MAAPAALSASLAADDDERARPARSRVLTPDEMLHRLACAIRRLAPVLAAEPQTDESFVGRLRAARFDVGAAADIVWRSDARDVRIEDVRLPASFKCMACGRTWRSSVSTAQLTVQVRHSACMYTLLACDLQSARQGCLHCEQAGSFNVRPQLVVPSDDEERRLACFVLARLDLYRSARVTPDADARAPAFPHQAHLCELCQTTGNCPAMRPQASVTRLSAVPRAAAAAVPRSATVPRATVASAATAGRHESARYAAASSIAPTPRWDSNEPNLYGRAYTPGRTNCPCVLL